MNLIPVEPCSQGYRLVEDLRAVNQIPQLCCVDGLFVPGEKAIGEIHGGFIYHYLPLI